MPPASCVRVCIEHCIQDENAFHLACLNPGMSRIAAGRGLRGLEKEDSREYRDPCHGPRTDEACACIEQSMYVMQMQQDQELQHERVCVAPENWEDYEACAQEVASN